MSLTPLPFLRIGFAILGLGLALGLALDESGTLAGWSDVLTGAAAFALVTATGEVIVRQIQAKTNVAPALIRKSARSE